MNIFVALNMEQFNLSFSDTKEAFRHKSDAQLKNSKLIFSIFKFPFLVNYGPQLTSFALKIKLPVKGLIKKTIFGQFCGGETIDQCDNTVQKLWKSGVGAILDYSVEGDDTESNFDSNLNEILETIQKAKGKDYYPFCVFKPTGIGRFALLEKIDANINLDEIELAEFYRFKNRFEAICESAADNKVRLFVDAEESWIQNIIDTTCNEMMEKYNREDTYIFNTVQMYRLNRIPFIIQCIEEAKVKGYKVGFKLVRGAYLEKEAERAIRLKYANPIHQSKADCDKDYDDSVKLCFENRDIVSICAGTHNEASSKLLARLMYENKIEKNDNRFWFAQLFGMSDNISFNLSAKGYNVAKYVPYGPIKSVLPYLGRRAKENSSMSGQMGRELSMILQELKRRKQERSHK
ncbi:MAG: proline dehydrogenase family protein [Flavobacteriales bacterium]|nr:proline dehydrogenase family protein [Flavobacteriales bacterium]